MERELLMMNLQMFADGAGGTGGTGDGGAGDAGTSTVGNNAVDGRQRLLELGVPESKIRKNREYHLPQRPKQDAAKEQKADEGQVPTVETNNPSEGSKPNRMSWEEIMADPEYNKQMQGVVQNRLKEAKSAQDALTKLAPAIDLLAAKYKMDRNNLDYAALASAVEDDDSYYEGRATELGVDVSTVKKMERNEREVERYRQAQAQNAEQERLRMHFDGLQQQAAQLKQIYPSFDLMAEMQNPVFARMTAPGGGLSVEQAYHALHHREIEAASAQVIARKTAEQLSNSIRSNQQRPVETGSSTQASSVQAFDYRTASKEQREALKRRIRSGEKVFPGKEF